MSTYESDPAGIGVGKRYGPLAVGGVAGELPNTGTQKELVFELAADEMVTGAPMTLPLPANYLVEALYLEVEEAFAASSVADLSIDGGAGLTTDFVLSTAAAIASVATTGLANLTGTSAVNIVLTPDANAIASGTGKARVIVQYKSV